ncbi:glycosyltransferase family 2 protein [Asaia sp. VD9]|uniref:glycosyltransferase family 2 protein n=1 Tax=Asaia sp. VD9 TaxID=3081235 RepID=UPI00301771F3
MASTAAILFIRNDADDIGWWIAYHLAVGFDTLIIHDDRSTDGSWEIIRAAAELYPIEAHRVPASEDSYRDRRSTAYTQAIAACRSRFDWVICLESDEYVLPETEDRIGAFLDRFPDADAVTLNWSIFGANGHAARTREAPIAAYTKRAPLDFADHRLGKTFLRPQCVHDHFIDGCHWAVSPGRHVHATGLAFSPEAPPVWEGARILHYVARNRTHYSRRRAHLTNQTDVPDLWGHFDRNDEEDLAAQRFLAATRHHAARIAHVMLETLFWRIRADIRDHSASFLPQTVFAIRDHESVPAPSSLRHAMLSTEDGQILAIDRETQALILRSPGQSGTAHEPVWLISEEIEADESAQPPRGPGQTGLLLADSGKGFPLTHSQILTNWYPVDIRLASAHGSDGSDEYSSGDMTALVLFSPLTAHAIGLDGEGAITLEAPQPLHFIPRPVPPQHSLAAALRAYQALRSQGNSFRDFCLGIDLLRTPQPEAMACAIAHLDPAARNMLETRYTGLIPLWLTTP